MQLQRVEVSGITEIVFKKQFLWKRYADNRGMISWVQVDGPGKLTQEEMMMRIRSAVSNPRMKLWVHGETLNIEKMKGES